MEAKRATCDESTHPEDRPADRTLSNALSVGRDGSLLAQITRASQRDQQPRDFAEGESPSLIDQFLQSPPAEALRIWFAGRIPVSKEEVSQRLNLAVAEIDRMLNDQLNRILHHPEFQQLEAAWRGLEYLVNCVDDEGDSQVVVRVFSATWRELERDFDRSAEFDRSTMFQTIYTDEFGQPGGRPFGIMIANYDIHPFPTREHPHQDVRVLQAMSQVAAAAFCPIIANASPTMFGMESFDRMEQRIDHSKTFSQLNYLQWNALRETADSRFLGLAMPRVLMRLPYEDDGSRVDEFQFREEVRGPDRSKYLWGGAAFALGEVVIRAQARSGWPASIRGLHRGEEEGGIVTRLPAQYFGTDRSGVAAKACTDLVVTEELERQLSELGFIPLCHCAGSEHAVFFSNQSLQKPKKYDRRIATVNAQISSMLQYMLCVSRFAHYVKVIGRDRTGDFNDAAELERYLHNWLARYVTADAEASPEVKSRHPLREARVRIQPRPGGSGTLDCVMHLTPHYELDDINAAVRIVAELRAPQT